MSQTTERIHELVDKLNRYRHEYYNEDAPSVSDAIYDHLYDELARAEKETGIILSSPAQGGAGQTPGLDALFDDADGDTDFYFDSEADLLQWFAEHGGIAADSAQALQDILDDGYVSIHEFVNPY